MSARERQELSFVVEPRPLFSLLLRAIGALAVLHVAAKALSFAAGLPLDGPFAAVFDLGRENNVPTVFSGMLLLTASALLAVAAAAERRASRESLPWAGLSAVFAFLSFDEVLGFHERLIIPVQHALKMKEWQFFAWVIPYGLAAALLGALYVPFLLRLPRTAAARFVGAGAVYVLGAVVVETIGGFVAERWGRASAAYSLETLLEESLEMLGAALFIRAILEHLRALHPRMAVRAAFEKDS